MIPWQLAAGAIVSGAVAVIIVKAVVFFARAGERETNCMSDDWLREHEYGEGQRGDES